MKAPLLLLCLLLTAFAPGAAPPEELLARFEAEGLPAAPLRERHREGLAKGVSTEAISTALEARARHLRVAGELLTARSYPLHAPPVQELWPTLGRVLESGMPAAHAERLLDLAGGQSAGRLASLLDAGESLYLSGLDEETVLLLLQDFYQRGLTRSELLRASRSARQFHAEGLRGDELRRRLEVSSSGRGGGGRQGPPEGRGGPGRHQGGR